MKKNIFSLICGAVLLVMLVAGCSGSFGFDGKDASGLGTSAGNGDGTGNGGGTGTGDNSKDNLFKDTTWENSENGITLAFDSDTCKITVGTAKIASIAREATAGQINAGTYSYTWKLNDDGSFTATLKYSSGDVYATFTIYASANSGKLMIDKTEFTFNKMNGSGTGTGGGTTGDGSGEDESGGEDEPGANDADRFEIKDGVLVEYKGVGSETAVTIPNTVKSIGDEAFKECSSLTNVTIPLSVESIGKEAFPKSLRNVRYEGNEDDWRHILLYIDEKSDATGLKTEKSDVTGLKYMKISSTTVENVSWDADGAKSYWKSGSYSDLTVGMQIETYRGNGKKGGISIPFGATSIKDDAFKGKAIVFASQPIPNTVKSIGARAFYNAKFLEGLYIPDGVVSIGESAFRGCWFNEHSIIIPDSVTSIGDGAFSDCTSIESVELSKGMTSIGEKVFWCCGLRSVKIPDSVTSIGTEAFFKCESLKEIKIPDSITSIGQGAFSQCSSIEAVTIPDGVTRIEDNTFSLCYELDDVTIPASVNYIGRNAFPGADPIRLKNVKYKGTEVEWKKIKFGTEKGTSQVVGLENCTIQGKDKEGNDATWTCKQHNY